MGASPQFYEARWRLAGGTRAGLHEGLLVARRKRLALTVFNGVFIGGVRIEFCESYK